MPSIAGFGVGSGLARSGSWLLLMLVVVGCQEGRTFAPPPPRPVYHDTNTEELSAQETEGPCIEAPPTWERVDALLDRSCRSCHSGQRVGAEARAGAPDGVDFDTEPQMRRHAVLIRSRAVLGTSMPPSAPLPLCSRTLL